MREKGREGCFKFLFVVREGGRGQGRHLMRLEALRIDFCSLSAC